MINFNNPIFKLLNLKIEPEAVTNFDYKSYEDLISSREKQEQDIKYEIYELLICIYKLKIEIQTLDSQIISKLSKIDKLKIEYEDQIYIYKKEEKDANHYMTKLYETINTIEKIPDNDPYIKDIDLLIQSFDSKVKQINEEYKEFKIENSDALLKEREELQYYKEKQGKIKLIAFDLKSLLTTFINTHTEYLKIVLKTGLDCRSEGLVWIIIMLLEMNCIIKFEMFPRFLKREHIEYLITIGELYIYYNQTKSILQFYKEKELKAKLSRKEDEEVLSKALRRTEMRKMTFSMQTAFLYNPIDQIGNHKYDRNNLEKNREREETSFRIDRQKKTFQELMNVDEDVKKYKEELTKIKKYGLSKVRNPNGELQEGSITTKSKKYMEIDINKKEILKYRKKGEEIIFQIGALKKKEIDKFKKEFERLRNINQNTKIEYDLMFCALFGHNTIH